MASIAIICFQANYIRNLYNNYLEEKIIGINENVRIAIEEEFNIRTRGKLAKERHVYYKRDITPEERDSLTNPTLFDNTIIDFSSAQKEGIGNTIDDILFQLEQDQAFEEGLFLDLIKLDSIFSSISADNFQHEFLLHNQDKAIIGSEGTLSYRASNYSSALYPIGVKEFQFIQIKAYIPMSEFVKNQFWMLVLSAGFMLIVLSCLLFQLIEIRNKSILLAKRETSVNGTIHDLKSPLNSIVTMLSWFKMKEKDSAVKQLIERSQTNVKHLVFNIESLLVTARKDRQRIILNKTVINLPTIVESIKNELSLIFQDKSYSIKIIDNLPDGIKILADPMYIENVIRNLIENSLKYSDNGVLVTVSMSISGDMVQVSIKDNGWGISPKYQKKIFSQFYQVPRNKDKSLKGYGIGLAYTHSIIKEHGGKITVASSENKGSIFSFVIPYSN